MAQAQTPGNTGRQLHGSINLLAIALIAAGAALFADGLVRMWSHHSAPAIPSASDRPVWLPHMPRKSELIPTGPGRNGDDRFKPYVAPTPPAPDFQPAVGVGEVMAFHRPASGRQRQLAARTAHHMDTLSRAISSDVWRIEGFPEALLRVQRYSAN